MGGCPTLLLRVGGQLHAFFKSRKHIQSSSLEDFLLSRSLEPTIEVGFGQPQATLGSDKQAGAQQEEMIRWPLLSASRTSSSPLEALEACLKGIPPGGSSPLQSLAVSWSRSPQPGDAGSQRFELQQQGSHSEGTWTWVDSYSCAQEGNAGQPL